MGVIFFPVCKFCKYHKLGKCENIGSAFWGDKTENGKSCEEFDISRRKTKFIIIKDKLKDFLSWE